MLIDMLKKKGKQLYQQGFSHAAWQAVTFLEQRAKHFKNMDYIQESQLLLEVRKDLFDHFSMDVTDDAERKRDTPKAQE